MQEDFAALRKLRDESECDELKQAWTGEDPRGWFGVTVADDRVTALLLSRCPLTALPAAIGELGALTTLDLLHCSSLAALPAAIGELGALNELCLLGCSSLGALPAAIGELGALTTLNLRGCSSLAALPDSIGKLGALTTLNLKDCWSLAALPAAIGELGALTELNLSDCSSLVALPGAIGELGALKELNLSWCKKLAVLPNSIGKLGALSELELGGCSSLTHPPEEMRDNVHKAVGFCCLNLLEGGDVSGDLKRSFVNHVVSEDAHAERVDALVRKDPAFADIAKAAKAILDVDLAALRKLRDDDASGALKELFGDGEDPREWKCTTPYGSRQCVVVSDGRVTKLILSNCSSLAALPAAIGELGALTSLNLSDCSSLAEVPATIGELGALTELNLYGCESLAALPAAIGGLSTLETLNLNGCESLAALPAAIGGLSALKTLVLGSCTSLAALPAAIGELGALTSLNLSNCSSLAEVPAAIGELKALTKLDLCVCESLAALPAAIGELKALTELNLRFCESLAALPDSIGKLDLLTELKLDGCSSLTYPPKEMHGNVHKTVGFCCLKLLEDGKVPVADVKETILHEIVFGGTAERIDALASKDSAFAELTKSARADVAALRKLRADDASGALKEFFGDGEDPREWKYGTRRGKQSCITVADGRVTKLSLFKCTSLAALPDAIGELKALTYLSLARCSSLTALPDAIGELGALTELSLYGCESLAALPAAIGELKALTKLDLGGCSSLAALPDAIGELKALTRLNLWLCSSLTALPDAIGELEALTTLDLGGCSSLAALPDAIGELKALTTLTLIECTSLTALPAAIGELKALTMLKLALCSSLVALPESIAGLHALEGHDDENEPNLDLRACPNLVFPPGHTHGDATRVKRLLANTTRFLANEISAADADDDAKADFCEGPIHHAPFADRLEEAVRKDPALADLTNDKGQRAIDLACLECRRAMQKALFFLGRYDVDKGPPEHRSATSLVVRAVDHEAADDYGKLFDEFDKDGSGTLDSNELGALATKLGTNVEILKLEDGQSYTRKAFVAKCQRLFGKERKVVLKIFQVEEQWRNEKAARDDQQLDARYVVQTIPAPTDDEFAKALGETNLFGEGVGSRAIVMDAANRNLFQIYQSERPDLNKVRMLMQQVMECVQHLHEKKLVHGDIKMLNVVRLSLDNRLRLIDLDAAAKVSRHDGDYVCAKFSSAILPPECFAKLNADQVTKFEAYFEGVDTELREKVAPKTKHGASYVVKTFSLTDDGAPKIDGLPYELVEASVAVDYWSLGALLFQLVAGEPLVPSNRDDDCVNAKSMAILASWNDHAAKKNLAVIKDAAARDLASKLLVRDPDERAEFSIADTLAAHPFFKPPKPGDVATQEKLDKIIEQQEKDSKKLDAILSLSEKHRDELRQTRSTLMRAIYEATEVSTPTAFVVLKERLPAGEASVELTLNDDGTGFVVEGEAVDEATDRYEESKTWLNLCARFGRGVAKCSPSAIAEAVAGACEELVVGEEMWLYLIDELTGKPVVPEGESIYPIRITKPAEVVSKLLPAMQVGLHAASLVNGVAGVVRLFGYPCPKVPEAWREGAQNSVEVLKQESSVEAFGAVHEKVQDGGEETETVRGAALRELEAFYANYDPDREYAGLRRIGDPSDGTAVWTLLTDPEEVKAAIEKRAAQRRAEARRHDERFQELMDNAEAGAAAAATTTPTTAAAGGGRAAARALTSPRR